MTHLTLISGSSKPYLETAMHRPEFTDTPGALDLTRPNYVPTANAYADCLHDGRHPYVDRLEHNVAVKRLTERAEAAEAEVERLHWAICHLLMRDGSKSGRVGVPLLALALTDGGL